MLLKKRSPPPPVSVDWSYGKQQTDLVVVEGTDVQFLFGGGHDVHQMASKQACGIAE